jgi:hypothetical protein
MKIRAICTCAYSNTGPARWMFLPTELPLMCGAGTCLLGHAHEIPSTCTGTGFDKLAGATVIQVHQTSKTRVEISKERILILCDTTSP